jgi:N-acetylglucosaminyldiphosphoundecaprenol N-acetyl-beta-D-mannosaminyltransferase
VEIPESGEVSQKSFVCETNFKKQASYYIERKGEFVMKQVVNILGVPFSKLTMDETVALLAKQVEADSTTPFHVITANPEIVISAEKDPVVKAAAREAGLITPDGIGVVMASRWKQEPVSERVAGYDLLLGLLNEGNRKKWSFYFLGSDEETNEQAADIISRKYPNIVIAGRHDGYFRDKESDVIADIGQVKPDVLVVALGAPRQEKWIYEHKQKLQAKVILGVGGSLDVIAGKVKRAPVFWQKLNLEWMYRLLSQPTRWRRQLALPEFAVKAYIEARQQRKKR